MEAELPLKALEVELPLKALYRERKITKKDYTNLYNICRNYTKRYNYEKKIVKESALLVNFIKCIAEEKYAEANKYLQQAIHSKLEAKIAQSINPTLF